MTRDYHVRQFDSAVDLDLDGCSIGLDLDIAELIDGSFADRTVIDLAYAPLAGTGIPSRQPGACSP